MAGDAAGEVRVSLSRAARRLEPDDRIAGRSRLAPFAAVVLVFAVDALFQRFSPPLVLTALMDEAAHAATALLLLAGLRRRPRRSTAIGVLLGAVLIDVDHVPMYLGWGALSPAVGRPYTHSLAVLLLSAALSSRLSGDRRRAWLGVAFGIATHLARDMATGGVPLLWPVADRSVALPYALYAALLLGALASVSWRRFSTVQIG